MPISEKPTQVQVNALLTPRHITQRLKVHMHARQYHPKNDSPKHVQVLFFNDGEEAPLTPKEDVMFILRENPHSLFIRQPEQSSITSTSAKSARDIKEIATPVQKDGPQTNWRSLDNGNGNRSVESPRHFSSYSP